MIRTFEYLPLLGDRMNDRFQRRSAISDAEPTGFDLGDHLGETTPNRTELINALVPKKPALRGRVRVFLPLLHQLPRHQSKFCQPLLPLHPNLIAHQPSVSRTTPCSGAAPA